MVDRQRLIWLNGEIVPIDQASILITSPTAQFGLNVFEGLRGYKSHDGKDLFLFRLPEHLKRLEMSCRLIGIESPYMSDEIITAIKDVIMANKLFCDLAIRVTLFVGGQGSWSSSSPVGLFIAPIAKSRQNALHQGLRAMVSSYERIDDRTMPPRIKVGANYINGRYAQLEATAAGFDVPILLDRTGKVSEGAGSCLMMVRNHVLVTAPTTSSILESITRDTLLTLALELGISTEVRVIDRTELYLADELFLCGSSAEITRLKSIDRYLMPECTTDHISYMLHMAYLHAACGGTPKWLTSV